MAMVRCDANEHHYDNSKHSSCPHCTSGRGNDDKTSLIREKKTDTGSSKPNTEKETVIRKPSTPSSGDGGPKTVAPWMNKGKTASDAPIAPIVGWLVLIEGNQKGRDFRVVPGINTIGRGTQNTINIDNGDEGISREKHCLIEYDYKNGQFYLERGTTSTYHNGGRVGGDGKELSLGDTIEIGSTKFKFIPFCNSDFCWEL